MRGLLDGPYHHTRNNPAFRKYRRRFQEEAAPYLGPPRLASHPPDRSARLVLSRSRAYGLILLGGPCDPGAGPPALGRGPPNLAWGGPAPILYQALWNRRVDQVRCGPSALEPGEDGPLMIIDLHTHVWTSLAQLGDELAGRLCASPLGGSGRLDASPAGHDRSMSCVDGSMVLGFRSDRLGARIPNEFIAEFASKDPRRRVGVAGVDPMSDDALDQVERTVGWGLVGVTVSPACQGFHPAHSAALRVYERCEALSLPLFVTQGVPAGVGPGLGAPLSANAVLEFARPGPWDRSPRPSPTCRS